MNMQDVLVGAYLYRYAVKLHLFVRILDKSLVNPMVVVRGVHDDYYSVLNAFLSDGEHDCLKLPFRNPLFRLVYDEGGDAVDRFQFRRLITA